MQVAGGAQNTHGPNAHGPNAHGPNAHYTDARAKRCSAQGSPSSAPRGASCVRSPAHRRLVGQPPEPEDLGADDGFRQFVEDTAPEGLQEMLEASAAYGSALAGEKSSSRPQIMSRVIRLMPEGSFSREEGLRAFGVLLREGRIRRVERGRFAIAPNSRFNQPQKKSAAG